MAGGRPALCALPQGLWPAGRAPQKQPRSQPPWAQVINEELAPASRRGGWLNTLYQTVRCRCPAERIPQYLVVDVAGLDIGGSVRLRELQLPPDVLVVEKVG